MPFGTHGYRPSWSFQCGGIELAKFFGKIIFVRLKFYLWSSWQSSRKYGSHQVCAIMPEETGSLASFELLLKTQISPKGVALRLCSVCFRCSHSIDHWSHHDINQQAWKVANDGIFFNLTGYKGLHAHIQAHTVPAWIFHIVEIAPPEPSWNLTFRIHN